MKKRILSLILALSMVLSVLPLGAFAADPPELVMENGRPDTANMTATKNPNGDDVYIGHNWGYNATTKTLTLTDGEFDFSLANPQDPTNKKPADSAVACAIVIESGATITGGTFDATVDNGDWKRLGGTISNGIFNEGVTNYGTINNGTFAGNVMNDGTIEKGTISGGTFKDSVINLGTITDGIFEGNVQNDNEGTISGGAFSSTVENYGGTISGGTFAAGLSWNSGNVTVLELRQRDWRRVQRR